MIVSLCPVVHRLRRTSPVSNSTCRYALDRSLSSSLCLSLSAYDDCPVESGGSSARGYKYPQIFRRSEKSSRKKQKEPLNFQNIAAGDVSVMADPDGVLYKFYEINIHKPI
jgi:hypothetical protein